MKTMIAFLKERFEEDNKNLKRSLTNLPRKKKKKKKKNMTSRNLKAFSDSTLDSNDENPGASTASQSLSFFYKFNTFLLLKKHLQDIETANSRKEDDIKLIVSNNEIFDVMLRRKQDENNISSKIIDILKIKLR